jgi:hypothetical protein
MTNVQSNLQWEPKALDKYTRIIAKIPLFHREIARQVVEKKAELNARDRKSALVQEDDIVRAFFSEVPMTFYSLMVRLLEEVGFDYRKFEHKA